VQQLTARDALDARALTDDAVVARVLAGAPGFFEILMRRYNQRLFRAALAVLRDHAEAEDVVQDAWVRVYTHLGQFAGRASFATWITRIAIHEALARGQRRVRQVAAAEASALRAAGVRAVDEEVGAREAATAIERAIDDLPDSYRAVFILREVEGLDVADTAACLELAEATVKTRLHRARTLLRTRLDAVLGVVTDGIFTFGGERCDRTVASVLRRAGPAHAMANPS
jgi:RNA polymerase sigma-70 factor (ECF subfamily)